MASAPPIEAAATIHAAPRTRDSDRAWLLGCAALAGAAHYVLATGAAGFTAPHPMVALAVLAIVFDLIRPAALPRAAGRLDWWLFAAALLACMLPFRVAAAPALACAGALAWRGGTVSGRAAGTLLAAVAGWAMKDGVWADFASTPVLTAEAWLTAHLLGLAGLAADATGNRIVLADGHSFVVLRACSVLSLAYPCAVGTFALSRMVRPERRPGAARIAGALALLAVLNTARLVAMVASSGVYDFLHNDSGVLPLQLAWAGIVLVAALPAWRRG